MTSSEDFSHFSQTFCIIFTENEWKGEKMGMYENLRMWDGTSMRVLLYVAGHPGKTKSEIIKTVEPEHNRVAFLKLQGLIESGYLYTDDSQGRDHAHVTVHTTERGSKASKAIMELLEASS